MSSVSRRLNGISPEEQELQKTRALIQQLEEAEKQLQKGPLSEQEQYISALAWQIIDLYQQRTLTIPLLEDAFAIYQKHWPEIKQKQELSQPGSSMEWKAACTLIKVRFVDKSKEGNPPVFKSLFEVVFGIKNKLDQKALEERPFVYAARFLPF